MTRRPGGFNYLVITINERHRLKGGTWVWRPRVVWNGMHKPGIWWLGLFVGRER